MSDFGHTLFGGGRFVRVVLTPFVLLFAVVMPLAIEKWTPAAVAVMVVMEFMCVALLIGFWLPSRFGHWAFRGLAGLVFLSYSAYLIYEFFFADVPFRVSLLHGEASPFNALLGFIIIGLPSLWYLLFGRFTLRAPNSEVEIESDDDAG